MASSDVLTNPDLDEEELDGLLKLSKPLAIAKIQRMALKKEQNL